MGLPAPCFRMRRSFRFRAAGETGVGSHGECASKGSPGSVFGLGTKRGRRGKKRRGTEQAIDRLREAGNTLSPGRTVREAVRQIGVTEQVVRGLRRIVR